MRFNNTNQTPPGPKPIRPSKGNQRNLLVFLLCVAIAACGQSGPLSFATGRGTDFVGMVAADEPHAALVGRDVLSNGGTAVDAAVAMAFVLAVAYPAQAGLASPGVCIVYKHGNEEENGKPVAEVLDFSPPPGAGAPPALLRGMYALHARYGKRRWDQLLGPAEVMARLGVQVSRALARQLAPAAQTLGADPLARQIFLRADGTPLAEGDLMTQPGVSSILARVGGHGVGEFYAGGWGRDVAQGVTLAGGSLTVEQLRDFAPQWREPVAVPYGNDTAFFPPLPYARGLMEAEMWAHLARDGAYDDAAPEERPHLFAETSERAFADRATWLAGGQDAAALAAGVISKDHLATLMAGYAGNAHQPAAGQPPTDPAAGTGFVAVQSDGSAVSCELTLNAPFGNGHVAPGLGILVPAAPPAGGSAAALGPMLAANMNSDQFRFAAAAGGGPAAADVLVQAALGALVEAKPIGIAVGATRIFAPNAPDVVTVEPGDPVADMLKARGHAVQEAAVPVRIEAAICHKDLPRDLSRCAVETDPREAGLSQIMGGR